MLSLKKIVRFHLSGAIFFLAAVVFVSIVPTQASDQDTPLFSAFKTYCLNAGEDAEQVKLAVEMLGGKPANPPIATTTPWPMTATSWNISVQGHKMILSIGTSQPPKGPRSTNCVINSFSDESESVNALRKWAGVPRDPNHVFPEFYNFYLDGAAHKPIEDKDTFQSAERQGKIWTLALIGENSLQFVHNLPSTPK